MNQAVLCPTEDKWMDYALEKEELLAHIESMCAMGESGKLSWALLSYEPLRFFIRNPFVHDLKTDISHCFSVKGSVQGRTFVYSIRETVNLPSGMCDIDIAEKLPDTEYSECLSFTDGYEYLTSQKEVLERYQNHPFFRFSNQVMEQIRYSDFRKAIRVDEKAQLFSFEPIPDEFACLPIVKKAQEIHRRCDAAAFHKLVLSNRLRGGLGIKDL